MDSTNTSIEYPPRPGSGYSTALTFSRNTILNGTVYLNGEPAFSVVTSKSNSRTDICYLPSNSTIATIRRRELFSDTVKFPARNGGSSVPIKQWLPSTTLPNNRMECTSLVTDLGNFVWRTDVTYRLALFLEHDANHPVAFMIRTRPPEPLVLHIRDGSEGMIEDVLVSFIILEQRIRMKEKRIQSDMGYV
ncbi:hypothetical protein CVT24_009271 [Panaeolus cyanescens]|uniref:DUF6593 domain-containing protein n=1 Tax=Panaeolus cyanescens TaxID=181874 RepID=A0A409Y822_9AGAR|nr:hypothetical protein CVT24_009271 [Panaeolus cyanescens]